MQVLLLEAGPLYSRGLVTPAAVKLSSCCLRWQLAFRPDAPRLEYFLQQPAGSDTVVKKAGETSAAMVDLVSSDSSSDESESFSTASIVRVCGSVSRKWPDAIRKLSGREN